MSATHVNYPTASLARYQPFNVTTNDVGTKSTACLPVPFLTAVVFSFITNNIIRSHKFLPIFLTFTSYRTKSVNIPLPMVINLNIASLLLLIFCFVLVIVFYRAFSMPLYI